MFQECRHIMPSGARCHSPALRGKPYCYFHARLHNLAVQPAKPGNPAEVEIDPLEDPSAVQLTITRVLTALGSGRIDRARAGTLLYGLQIAAALASRNRRFAAPEAVQDISLSDEGQPLAAENVSFEPLEDCDDCPTPGKCLDCKLLNILQTSTPSRKD
jgi:hypothetical protein